VAKNITTGSTEAPGMFKRNGIYYVVYSDPNCGYCSGTGASYKTASSPLGPWSDGKKISDNSCGGQPSFVSTIKLGSGTVFLFGSDLWNNAAKNEALANYYWAPLTFAADGSINPMTCEQAFKISPSDNKASVIKADAGFKTHCDISKNVQRSQSFIPASTGILTTIELTTFKTGYPDAELVATIFKADKTGKAIGEALSTEAISATAIGWSAKRVAIHPKTKVTKGAATGVELYSNDGGKTFSAEKNRELKLQIHIGK
jgi:hypothetical protein